MIVTFSRRFPKEHRASVQTLVLRFADAYGLANGWECRIRIQPKTDDAQASVHCILESHTMALRLTLARLKDMRVLEVDIAHELLHVLYWRTFSTIKDLPEGVQLPVLRAFEEDHDQASRRWHHLLCGGTQ